MESCRICSGKLWCLADEHAAKTMLRRNCPDSDPPVVNHKEAMEILLHYSGKYYAAGAPGLTPPQRQELGCAIERIRGE